MSHFDEKSGTVDCKTTWGLWHQTIDEVVVLVDVPEGTRGKQMNIAIKAKSIRNKTWFAGLNNTAPIMLVLAITAVLAAIAISNHCVTGCTLF